jgi:hypothetical protein
LPLDPCEYFTETHGATSLTSRLDIERQHLIEGLLETDEPCPDKLPPCRIQGDCIHGKPFADRGVGVIAQALAVGDSDQKKIERCRLVTADVDMAVTDQAVVDPAELLRNVAQSFGTEKVFLDHKGLRSIGLDG